MTPVPRPRFFLEGRGNKLLGILVVALTVALVKPWGSFGSPTPAPSQALLASPSPQPTPTPTPTPDPADLASRIYDPLVFGDHELQPAWGLWPAGYLVSFGFAMRADSSAAPNVGPVPSASRPDATVPIWPAAIDIPLGNHLLLIGVNTPTGFSVDRIQLVRREADGSSRNVAVKRLASPWPSHFTVIAIDPGNGTVRTDFWAPGTYRLELTIDPGPIVRSVDVRVEGPAVGTATPSVPPG